MIRPTDLEFTSIPRMESILEIGKMINRMASAWRRGLMDLSTLDNIIWATSTDSALTSGKTVLSMWAPGTTTKSQASAFTSGSTAGATKASGLKITTKELESTNGKTVANTKENIT